MGEKKMTREQKIAIITRAITSDPDEAKKQIEIVSKWFDCILDNAVKNIIKKYDK